MNSQPITLLDATIPLSDAKNAPVYGSILDYIKKYVPQADMSVEKYEKAKNKLANYIYLTYENVMLNITRDIDYEPVKYFVRKNSKLVTYFFNLEFKNKFPFAALENWMQYEEDMQPLAMHNNSTRFNKHMHH